MQKQTPAILVFSYAVPLTPNVAALSVTPQAPQTKPKVPSSCASTLRGVGRQSGRFRSELLGVLRVQLLPAGLHRLAADDGSPTQKPIQNIERNVPPGGAPRDEAAIDVVPQSQTRAVTK